MKQVDVAQDLIEAQSIKNRLDGNGINSVVQANHRAVAGQAVSWYMSGGITEGNKP
jgi:hypothetical protein